MTEENENEEIDIDLDEDGGSAISDIGEYIEDDYDDEEEDSVDLKNVHGYDLLGTKHEVYGTYIPVIVSRANQYGQDMYSVNEHYFEWINNHPVALPAGIVAHIKKATHPTHVMGENGFHTTVHAKSFYVERVE